MIRKSRHLKIMVAKFIEIGLFFENNLKENCLTNLMAFHLIRLREIYYYQVQVDQVLQP